MAFKKNQLLLMYWVILGGFVTSSFGKKFGVPYLFLDPEYIGSVGFISFFLMGLSLGIFMMAFNISSYMLNSFRFPFLASLYKTFEKYSYNNIVLPLIFLLLYIICIIRFQYSSQLQNFGAIALQIVGLLSGITVVIYGTLKYFQLTNKDIYKLFGVATTEVDIVRKRKRISPIRDQNIHKADRRTWRVETYIVFPFKVKLVRSTSHYKSFMLESVFRQNHINAAVLEIIIFVTFILLGLFRDYSVFRIPAGASVLLLFTMIIMIAGVLRYWLRAWANTLFFVLFLLINFLSGFKIFNVKNKAFGLDFDNEKPAYHLNSIQDHLSREKFNRDYQNGLLVLNNRKSNLQKAGIEKPKLVFLNVSGGGVRSALYTFKTLMLMDSVLDGKLMDYTHFISGSSGGLIGAAYYRELFMRSNHNPQYIFGRKKEYIKNISKDLLNATVFSFTVSDLTLNFQRFKYGKYTYLKDRAYAFEQQLNDNTDYVFDKRLDEYLLPEQNADIPMLVISPNIVNDGRTLMISPLPVSYLLKSKHNIGFEYAIADGIELKSFFKNQDAGNLRFITALRMNSTFPYIMPAATLPSEPAIEVMDAGIRDNYGVLNSIRYLLTFKEWIMQNTSGVVFVQIRDNTKFEKVPHYPIKTILGKLLSPFRNVSGNFIVMQDYQNDLYLESLKAIFGKQITFINFEMPQREERISLSWHLTEKEKLYIVNESDNGENIKSLEKLKELLNFK